MDLLEEYEVKDFDWQLLLAVHCVVLAFSFVIWRGWFFFRGPAQNGCDSGSCTKCLSDSPANPQENLSSAFVPLQSLIESGEKFAGRNH